MVTVGMSVFNSLILMAYNYVSVNVPRSFDVHPDEGLGIRAQIARHGYPMEEYETQTPDGFLLSMFRIPHGANQKESYGNSTSMEKRPPVLIMHGFLSSAQDFVLLGPEVSIAYSLADNGYDVWLGNCRGNTHSRKHVKYHPDDPQFWRFSFHEMGYYDIPTMLDYITEKTGFDNVFYIGHSQGTTSMFVMASERPEYIKKVRVFVALAPVAFTKVMPAMLAQVAATFYKQLEYIIYKFGYIELFPHTEIIAELFRLLCRAGTPYASLCEALIYTNMGYSQDMDPTLLPLIVGSFPAGASTRQILHFIQNKLADGFRKYDHGTFMNLRVYGQIQPPKYNLRTKLPTALIYSNNDWLSTEQDVERISSELKNIKLKHKMPEWCNHADYIFGRQAPKIILPIILKLFSEN